MNASVRDAVMFCAIDKKRKLIHFEGGFHPLLYDLQTGPLELVDLGARADQAKIIADKYHKLFTWTRRQSQRTTRSDAQLVDRPNQGGAILFLGVYDENDTPLELTIHDRGRQATNMKAGPKDGCQDTPGHSGVVRVGRS
ncbi:MAG: hypothetical protein CMF72_09940 [Mameliella sp.]|nr:hypothetical protein [Mameliella sp.]|tara:strand:+ start:895 stop:1314 length:420 start_codon:yes stop_codon:yes gene_type:complete